MHCDEFHHGLSDVCSLEARRCINNFIIAMAALPDESFDAHAFKIQMSAADAAALSAAYNHIMP